MATKNIVEELSENNFNSFVKQGNAAIDFWASWCMPCVMMAPVVEELAGKFKKFKFGKVNVEDNEELAKKFNVLSIPTLIIFKNGKEAGRITGALQAEVLEEKLKAYL